MDLTQGPSPSLGLDRFADWLNSRVDPARDNILCGYSMGGRLALHCLKRRPALWSGAIFLSTHPGLIHAEDRKRRLKSDGDWAQRFEKDPWEALMADWNAQPVFDGDSPFRREGDYDRRWLSEALQGWSLGHQEDFRPFLNRKSIPILWICGEKDLKFSRLSESIAFSHLLSKKWIVEGAGHRLGPFFVDSPSGTFYDPVFQMMEQWIDACKSAPIG